MNITFICTRFGKRKKNEVVLKRVQIKFKFADNVLFSVYDAMSNKSLLCQINKKNKDDIDSSTHALI